MSNDRLRKIMIMIEETGGRDSSGNQNFNVYLGGDKERIGIIPDNELSAAEYWGDRLFRIVAKVLQDAGACEGMARDCPAHYPEKGKKPNEH